MRRQQFLLTEKGPPIELDPYRPTVALLNANPFAEGIANLGAQVVAEALLAADLNVDFGFADTMPTGRLAGGTPAGSADVIAVSIPFEDTYHHVPRMLRQAGVPLFAADRADDEPVVVAGGMALINPMPLSPFFDAMVIGEGRVAMPAVVDAVVAGRRRGAGRAAIVRDLAAIPHVFVPGLYRFRYDDVGAVVDCDRHPDAPAVIEPGRPLDMDRHPIHSIWTTERACYKYPDYYSVMVAMGCHLKCPFCVVGAVQGAPSGRALNGGIDTIVRLAEERRDRYGTRLVKLFFASSYSSSADIDGVGVKTMLEVMLDRGFECRVGSLNIKQADDELLALVKQAGQDRVTFAPETGASLRPSIGKPYSRDEKLAHVAELAGRHGLGLDVYTMLGVPGEEPAHVRELAALITEVRRALSPDQVLEVSINPAFSKAQTPYERRATLRPEESRARFAYLRGLLPSEDGISWVTVLDDPMAYYQPILSLGGPELAPVLAEVSASFWPSEDDWVSAVHRHVAGGDHRYFRDRDSDEVLPWQHVVYNDHTRLAVRLDGHRRRAAAAAVAE